MPYSTRHIISFQYTLLSTHLLKKTKVKHLFFYFVGRVLIIIPSSWLTFNCGLMYIPNFLKVDWSSIYANSLPGSLSVFSKKSRASGQTSVGFMYCLHMQSKVKKERNVMLSVTKFNLWSLKRNLHFETILFGKSHFNLNFNVQDCTLYCLLSLGLVTSCF